MSLVSLSCADLYVFPSRWVALSPGSPPREYPVVIARVMSSRKLITTRARGGEPGDEATGNIKSSGVECLARETRVHVYSLVARISHQGTPGLDPVDGEIEIIDDDGAYSYHAHTWEKRLIP